MPRPRFQDFPFRILAALLAATGSAFADETATTGSMHDDEPTILDFFDTMLPGTLREHHITLHFTPKFSDFRDQNYIRYPFELRYGLSDRWELSAGLTPFSANPFGSGRDHRWGPGEAVYGARYDVGRSLDFFDATTVGVEMHIPIGKPPTALNDNYTHVKPWFAGTRKLHTLPDTTFYLNLSYDRSVELTPRGAPPPGVVRMNTLEVIPGLLFKPSEFAYFAEYHFRHIGEDLAWHLAHEVRIGTIWDVPLARSQKWNLPGKWQVELAYVVDHEEDLGTHQSVAAQVNWRTSLREMLDFTHVK